MADESNTTRLSSQEMLRLAASAVHKVDLLGPRGSTLISQKEIEAMACVIVASDAWQYLIPRYNELQKRARDRS